MYQGSIANTAWNVLEDMHDPAKHNGVYVNFPSGVTETVRDVDTIKAVIMAGFDAVFQFNQLGFHQEGYQNAVVAIPGDSSSFRGAFNFFMKSTDFHAPENGFVKPQISFYGNVGDDNGAVSPSGILREKYNQIRRVNLFMTTFETRIAGAGQGIRTVFPRDDSLRRVNNTVRIEDARVGVSCNYTHVIFRLCANDHPHIV